MNRAALSRRAHYDQGPSLGKLAPVTLALRAVFALSVSHRRNLAMPADRELHLTHSCHRCSGIAGRGSLIR